MELAIAAIGKVAAGLGLSSAGAAATGATAATTTAAGSGALTALQGFSTALQVLGGLGAGAAAARATNQQADQADLEAGQEQLAGTQRQNKMRRELARVLGQNEVAYSAAGIDLTQGVAADSAARAKQQAASEISIDQQDTDFRRSLYRMRAQGLRQRARSERGGALLGALVPVAQYGISVAERG
ncbi:hypothetical protein [Brucella anthropi]|uniref:hypothetical protein n=1 Tax=Brucella anthropi TaxID=529 RepID=UPI003D96032B